MSAELALPTTGAHIAPPVGIDSWMPVLASVGELAASIARTSFVPKDMQGKPEAVAAAILLGRELGLPPMRSLAEISVIQGRPTLSATVMRALVLAQGHTIEVRKWTDDACTLVGYRHLDEDPTATVTWTIADAQKAGLTGRNPTWRTHPRAMLLARATSELCRAAFADVIAGVSATEDLDQPTETQRETQRTTVRRRTTPEAPPEPVRATQSDETAAGVVEPTPEPSDTSEPAITAKQSRMLHARLREVGLADRDAGLAAIAALVGREIGSTKELTVAEASLVIDRLEEPTPQAE